MTSGYQALTDKEKQTLRLLLAGHDAKSLARHFGLSVHTINERLRDARRKLSASSSREAARLLRDAEEDGPESVGDKDIGDAAVAPIQQESETPQSGRRRRAAWAVGGFAMIAFAIAAIALAGASHTAQHGSTPAGGPGRPARVAETPVTQAARQFLALVDAGNWQDSYAGWGQQFHAVNTFEAWRSASVGGRVPLGRVLSRRLLWEESVPAPPNGYEAVRFQTAFANKPHATETLTLAREGGAWKVAGYIIE